MESILQLFEPLLKDDPQNSTTSSALLGFPKYSKCWPLSQHTGYACHNFGYSGGPNTHMHMCACVYMHIYIYYYVYVCVYICKDR